ncbi:MAG: hypothetical protein QM610_00590 [Chitinophagaceae bacterium]
MSIKPLQYLLLIVLALTRIGIVRAQDSVSYSAQLHKAKDEMNLILQGERPDYIKAGKILEPLVSVNPGNAEAWYYFGYAIDEYNMGNSEEMLKASLPLAMRASDAFQNCIELSDGKYKGSQLLFDPHTKILTIWGNQAFRYFNQGDMDSAYWCLNQAAIRGGINQSVLGYFRQVMQECGQNAYLFTNGDMYAYYLAYLQTIQHFRTDINCIDLNFLQTGWAVPLYKKMNVLSDSMALVLQKGGRKLVNDSVVVRNDNQDAIGGDGVIRWKVRKTTSWTKGDIAFLNLLQTNRFRNDVFIVADVPSQMRLGLNVDNYLQLRGLTFKMVADTSTSNLNFLESRLSRLNPIPIDDSSFRNNPDNIQVLNNYRFAYTAAAVMSSAKGDLKLALDLIDLSLRKYPEQTLPFYAAQTKDWFYSLRSQAERGEPLKW